MQSEKAGNRVISVKINGKDLSLTKKYTVAMPDFIAAGGGGYDMFVGTKKVGELGALEEVLMPLTCIKLPFASGY